MRLNSKQSLYESFMNNLKESSDSTDKIKNLMFYIDNDAYDDDEIAGIYWFVQEWSGNSEPGDIITDQEIEGLYSNSEEEIARYNRDHPDDKIVISPSTDRKVKSALHDFVGLNAREAMIVLNYLDKKVNGKKVNESIKINRKKKLKEADEIDHLIQRGSVYIPVRKGQRDDKVLNHLETLGGMNDVPPSEEELATGKYRPVAKYVYANGNGGLMTGEYEKIEDEELEETTSKELEQRKDNLYNDIRQSLKDNGDKEWENTVGYKSRLPKELVDKFDKADRELWCIEMIHSILTYSPERNPDVIIEDKYLKKYIDELGKDKVMELVNQEIEEYKNATITKDVYTDSEGVTYNSVKFKDDINEEDKLTEGTKAKRISHYGEFDNGHVFHKWYEMSDEEAENKAKQMSIEHPDDVWYVAYDDVMNPGSTKRWFRGKEYPESKGYDIYCKACRNGFNVKSPEEQNKILSDLGLNEAIERKYEKSNPDYNSRKKDVRTYTGSYTYLFSGKVSTEYNGDPITIDYFYYERPYDRTTYNLVVNVLTPLDNYDGEYIQKAIEDEWYNTDTKYTRLSQKEIKEKILQIVSSLN